MFQAESYVIEVVKVCAGQSTIWNDATRFTQIAWS